MAQLIASSATKEGLQSLINKFYCSENWIINDDNQAENKKTGKKLGNVIIKNKRYRFEL